MTETAATETEAVVDEVVVEVVEAPETAGMG